MTPKQQERIDIAFDELDEVLSRHWSWRNCRAFALRFDFWLWPWAWGRHTSEDWAGGERWLYLGPLCVGIAYNIGEKAARSAIRGGEANG